MSTEQVTKVYLGYTTSVYLFGRSTPIFCTSLSFSINQQIITSSGSFRGTLNLTTDQESPTDQNLTTDYKPPTEKYRSSGPMRLDYPDVQASVSFQTTVQYLEKILEWIKKRQEPRTLRIKTCVENGDIFFNQCYWTNISLNVSQGQLLTCSISMMIRDEYEQKKISKISKQDQTTKNGTGPSSNVNLGNMYIDANILPYYATCVQVGTDDKRSNYITGWSIDLSQNLIKKAYCSASGYGKSAPLPNNIMVGNMTANVKITVLNADTLIPLYDKVTDVIDFDNFTISQNEWITVKYFSQDHFKTFLKFGYNMLQSVSPVVSQQSSLQQIQYTYVSHKIMQEKAKEQEQDKPLT